MKVLRLLSYEPTRCWCTQARARKELLQPFFMEQHWFMMQRLVLYFLIVTDHACQVIFNFRSLWWIVFFKKINHDSIFYTLTVNLMQITMLNGFEFYEEAFEGAGWDAIRQMVANEPARGEWTVSVSCFCCFIMLLYFLYIKKWTQQCVTDIICNDDYYYLISVFRYHSISTWWNDSKKFKLVIPW